MGHTTVDYQDDEEKIKENMALDIKTLTFQFSLRPDSDLLIVNLETNKVSAFESVITLGSNQNSVEKVGFTPKKPDKKANDVAIAVAKCYSKPKKICKFMGCLHYE